MRGHSSSRAVNAGYALVTVLFVFAVVFGAVAIASGNIPPHPSIDLGVAGFSLPGNALLGGLGAFILAEVLAHGLRLREDVEGTI